MSRRQRILFRIIFFLYVATVLLLCFCQFNSVPNVPRTILGYPTDKVVHFCMFFPFPILAFLAFDQFTDTVPATLGFAFGTFLLGALLALGTEWGQATFTNYRTGDRLDLMADFLALGISSVIIIVWDIVKQLFSRRKACKESS